MLSSSKAAQIKSHVVLSSVIKKAVQLKGHGPKYVGLCPFHEEKTPSFNVDDKVGRFKCFGCNASGDVFEFIMRLRGLSFKEAIDEVAQSTGIVLGFNNSKSKNNSSSGLDPARELLRAQKIAHEYFIAHMKPGAKGLARDYLVTSRHLSSAMIDQAALGFGGLSSREFLSYLEVHKISQDTAIKAGLLKIKSSSLESMFLRRIVFPIRRFDGKVVAFGGRSFLEQEPDRDAPKYINTHAYMLYEKRNNFYGLFESKAAILKGQTPVLVEGYFDAMALWAIGVPALALCGTALSANHAAILKRLVSRLILCFDGDKAGFRALRSSLVLLWNKNISSSIITLNKKDPGEYLSDLPALKVRLEHQQDALCFAIDQAREVAFGDIASRVSEIDQLVPIFMNIARPLVRRQYVAYLAKQLHEDAGLLWAEISGRLKNNKSQPEKDPEAKPKNIMLNATEKLVAQIIMRYPVLADKLSAACLEFLSSDFKGLLLGTCETNSPLERALRAESAHAPHITLPEAQELLKALDNKLARLSYKNQLKENRKELQQAEKNKDFSLMFKSLKEQSLILAHNKTAKPQPTSPPKPNNQKNSDALVKPSVDYTEEEDWL